ncbi:MAG TPA: nitronate monooxygenase, partial [Parafilimonas sp.]|nr:nitronate monooxygenase [Parafilimonas sp.]
DLNESQLNDIINLAFETKLDGIVATNTTIERNNLLTSKKEIENIGAGGLSGKPLQKKSTEVLQYIIKNSNNKIPVIASGGIFTGADAIEKLNNGAALVQVWTGFIYEGPSIAKKINKQLIHLYNR